MIAFRLSAFFQKTKQKNFKKLFNGTVYRIMQHDSHL